MTTIDLNLVRTFVAVHTAGSFSAAAARLGVPRSTVSRNMASLESALATRLFHRTTRNVSPTTAGAALFDRVAPSLLALEGSLSDVPEREKVPSGLLRVTSTSDLGSALLAEAAARFSARWPNANVEVHLSNAMIDLVRDGFDLALRVHVRPPASSTLVARKVGVIDLALYASPAYVARKGAPRAPEEIAAYDWVGFRGVPSVPIEGPSGKVVVTPTVRIAADDQAFLIAAVKAGAGIGALAQYMAEADVATGALVRVLPKWTARVGYVYVVQPGKRHVPRKVTAFREVLAEVLRKSPIEAGLREEGRG